VAVEPVPDTSSTAPEDTGTAWRGGDACSPLGQWLDGANLPKASVTPWIVT
jgi:hypothetical protein